jgi:type VI secretion system protein ImpC
VSDELSLDRFEYVPGRDPRPDLLPCRILVLADVLGPADSFTHESRSSRLFETPIWETRTPRAFDLESLKSDLGGFRPALRYLVEVDGGDGPVGVEVQLDFGRLSDFDPTSIASRLTSTRQLALFRYAARSASCALATGGSPVEAVRATVTRLTGSDDAALARVRDHGEGALASFEEEVAICRNDADVDALIARLGTLIGRITEAAIAHPDFRALEARWRSIELIARAAKHPSESAGTEIAPVLLEILHATSEELLSDFAESIEPRVHEILYHKAYATYGGKPYTAVVLLHEFDCRREDLTLLRHLSAVGATVQAPVLASASPALFGLPDFARLASIADLEELLAQPTLAGWRMLRSNPTSRFLSLCLPRILVRAPHPSCLLEIPVGGRDTIEQVPFSERGAPSYLWGYASAALAAVIVQAFVKYRWSVHIVGLTGGGLVEWLPGVVRPDLGYAVRPSTDALLTDIRERQLARAGFATLLYRRDKERPCFFSAPTVAQTRELHFDANGELNRVSLDDWVNGQLPYLLIATRIAHFLKTAPREWIGENLSARELSERLSGRLNEFCSKTEMPDASTRGRRPLKDVHLEVKETNLPGLFRSVLELKPHLTALGAAFSLRLDLELGFRTPQ